MDDRLKRYLAVKFNVEVALSKLTTQEKQIMGFDHAVSELGIAIDAIPGSEKLAQTIVGNSLSSRGVFRSHK